MEAPPPGDIVSPIAIIQSNKLPEKIESFSNQNISNNINQNIYGDLKQNINNNIESNKPIEKEENNSVSLQIPQRKDFPSNLENNDDLSKEVSVVQSEFHLDIELSIRSKFMLKVYGILLAQFIFTFGLILICQINKIKNYLIHHIALYIILISISGLVYLVTFIVFTCNPKLLRKVPQNYIILFIITICLSILLTYISILYSYQCVLGAISFVTAICVSIFVISLFNKIDIKYIFMLLITFIFLSFTYGLLAIIFRNYYLLFLYCLIGVTLFSLFIVYDTQFIRDNFDIDDYIFASLTLYLDIIRLFIEILKILGNLNGNSR